jgi:acyl dehydratase
MRVPGAGASTKASDRGAATAHNPAPKRAPDAVVREKTTPEQGALYRAASGDLNPLHIDPAVAKAGGFEGPILTGTCTMGFGVKHVIDKFAEGDASRFRSVKLRLSKPVYPGEIVTTEMWREDGGRKIMYRQLVEAVPEMGKKEKVVMTNAAVLLKDASSRSNL